MKANTIDVVERQMQAIDHATTPEGLIPANLAKSLVQEQADTIERLRAELAAKVPEGYVVVPVEPTEAMVKAGVDDLAVHGEDRPVNWEVANCYSAMITVAEGGE